MQHSRIKVVSGNFVTARPMGIIDGVDYLHTGVVRKVDAESIQDLLSRGNIVLVSPTGFSPTGEAFNLTTEDVATAIAVAIHADKLILSVGVDGVRVRGEKQQDLTAQQAQALIQSKQVDDEDVYNLGYAYAPSRAALTAFTSCLTPWTAAFSRNSSLTTASAP